MKLNLIMNSSTLKIKCKLCNKYYSQKSSLNRHIKEQHLNPKFHRCEQCQSRFSNKYNLDVHTATVHSKERDQLQCSHCSSIFTKLRFFNEHVKDCQERLKSKSTINICSKLGNETDAQSLADSVLKELKQLQQDIQTLDNPVSNCIENKREPTNMEKSTVQIVKDNLYPYFRDFTLIEAQTIIRADGFKYFICEFCGKEFRKTYNFLRHRRVHTKLRPYICVLCKAKFPTTSQLKSHFIIHKLNEQFGFFHKLYKCPKCNEGFSAIQQLDKHLSTSPSCTIVFKCPNCGKKFKSLKKLLSHKHSEKDTELEMLNTVLPEPLTLKELPSTSINIFECNFCGIKVKQKTSFKHHVKRHEDLFRSQCVKCQKSFASKSALKIHNKIHRSAKNFKCQYCKNFYSTAESCRRHMKAHVKQLLNSHHNKREYFVFNSIYVKNDENETTDETNRISIIKYRNKFKETTNADDNLNFKCSECEKSFRYKSWLRKHYKYKHTNELSFQCNSCLKQFRTKQSLENHFIVHSTERLKCTCQVCGKQYASSKSLKLHLRIHTLEKPFSCKFCNLTFRTSGHIIQHYKAHH